MNFAELTNEVYTITNRSDLTAETQLALRRATVKFHSIDFFPRDLVEIPLVVPTPSVSVQIDINAALPRFRAIAYIRDASTTGTPSNMSRIFTKIEPRALLDEYHIAKTDIWYIGGQVINISSSSTVSNLLIGYYANPIITPIGDYASWIAVDQPYTLVEEAAANIFRMTGNAEMAKFYENQSMQNAILLRQNYLEGVAR